MVTESKTREQIKKLHKDTEETRTETVHTKEEDINFINWCPLRPTHGVITGTLTQILGEQCWEANCAWWHKNCCAIISIAKSLDREPTAPSLRK